jgi:hypothetical protein
MRKRKYTAASTVKKSTAIHPAARTRRDRIDGAAFPMRREPETEEEPS